MLNYNFMISSSKISPFGEGGRGGLKRTQNGCWEIDAGAKLGYCMRNERRGCLFSIYSALHHLLSANPLAAIRTSDHAVSLTSAWITAECVCVWVSVCAYDKEGEGASDAYPTIWNLVKYSLTIIPLWPRSWMMLPQREREKLRGEACVHVCARVYVRKKGSECQMDEIDDSLRNI